MSNRRKWNKKYEESFIKKTLIEIFFYLIFLITISLVSLCSSGSKFYFSQMLNKLLVERSFTLPSTDVDINFSEITQIFEYWLFCENILLNSLYDDFLKESILLGPARIRQIRVRNNSCNIHGEFENYFKNCFGFYTSENEELNNFGIGAA